MSMDVIRRARPRNGNAEPYNAVLSPDRPARSTLAERIDSWSTTFEPELRRFAGRYWAELIAAAAVVGITLYLLMLFTRYPLPPGTDAGQWLTISRYYLGEHVPVGRTVSTVLPVVPWRSRR